MCRDQWRRPFVLCVLAVALPAGMSSAQQAQAPQKAQAPQQAQTKSDAYDVLYARYLEAARKMPQDEQASISWMTNLSSDPRAHAVNDLVTVRVVESVVAAGSADTALDKKGSAAAAVAQLFGAETKLPDWLDSSNLVSAASATDFKGGGTTTRSGELTARITTRVSEVLPNGDLVLEGIREIDINGDRQIIVLTGVVRKADLLPDNSVLSARVGQLRIRYFGNGLMKDNLKPGWLIRVLNKIF